MSDIGLEELRYLCRQYFKLPYDKEREEAICYAIKRLDELGIQEWRLVNAMMLNCHNAAPTFLNLSNSH